MGKNGTHRSHTRCHPYPIPQPVKLGHTTGVYTSPTLFERWCGYGFSPLCEKTRKSNHLQMSLQKQQFLLSYFKDPERWSGRGFNPRPPAQHTGALPTEQTRRRFFIFFFASYSDLFFYCLFFIFFLWLPI